MSKPKFNILKRTGKPSLFRDVLGYLFNPTRELTSSGTRRVFVRNGYFAYPKTINTTMLPTVANSGIRLPSTVGNTVVPRYSEYNIKDQIPLQIKFTTQVSSLTLPKKIETLEYTPKEVKLLTFDKELLISKPALYGSLVILPEGEEIIRLPQTSMLSLVNHKGDVDWDVYELLMKVMESNTPKTRMEVPYNSSGGYNDHVKGVVESALSSPTPTNATLLEFVASALLHDVGKLYTSQRDHDKVGANMLNNYVLGIPLNVSHAIKHHMTKNILDYDPLTRGLHFADVARGMPYEEAAYTFPQLLYPRKGLVMPTFKRWESLRDEFKYAINPILLRYGYDTIPLDASTEEKESLLLLAINRHRTFIRGVRDPYKSESNLEEDIRNVRNANSGVRRNYMMEPNPLLRLLYSAEYVPMDPTGSGRAYLFNMNTKGYGKGRLPVHEHDNSASALFGVNPKTKDALYFSNSNAIGSTYTTSTDDRPGESLKVRLLPVEDTGLSPSVRLLLNDFPIFNHDRITSGRPSLSNYYMFEEPYRVQTGRSLQQDILKEDPNVPKLEYERLRRDYVIPTYNWEENGNYNGHPTEYQTLMKTMLDINEMSSKFGVDKKIYAQEDGTIYSPKAIKDLKNRLSLLLDVVLFLDYVPDLKGPIDYSKLKDYNNLLYFYKNGLRGLHSAGIVTDKLYELTKKVPSWNLKKYLNSLQLTKRAWDLYFLQLLQDKKLSRGYVPTIESLTDRKHYLANPYNLLLFLRVKGVTPRYEYPNFLDEERIYGNSPMFGPKRKQDKTKHIHAEIIGDKGDKKFEVVGKADWEERRHVKQRDKGEVSSDPEVSRKSYKKGGKL